MKSKSFQVCHWCIRPIYRGGVEFSPAVGRGFANGVWYSHKSCLRRATGNHPLMSNLFRMAKKTREFIKADLVNGKLS